METEIQSTVKKQDNKNRRDQEVPKLDVFENKLRGHKWSIMIDNYRDFMRARTFENDMYNLAMKGGPTYVRKFADLQCEVIKKHRDDAVQFHRARFYRELEEAVKTGDNEFDEFAQRVRNHDWTWQYSDDGNVARNASAREDELLRIVKEKGGIYATYWKFISRKNGRGCN